MALLSIMQRLFLNNDRYFRIGCGVREGGVVPAVGLLCHVKKYFYELAGPWLLGVLDGELEDDDKFTLNHPDKAYLEQGVQR